MTARYHGTPIKSHRAGGWRRHAALLAQFSTESRTLVEDLETALSDLAEMAEQVDRTEARAKEAEDALVQERAVMARLRGMLSSEG